MNARRIFPALLFALSAVSARAQFSSSVSQNVTGQMGAGTTTPQATLDVMETAADKYALWVSCQNGAPLFFVDNAGNVDIGRASTGALVNVFGVGDDGDIGSEP